MTCTKHITKFVKHYFALTADTYIDAMILINNQRRNLIMDMFDITGFNNEQPLIMVRAAIIVFALQPSLRVTEPFMTSSVSDFVKYEIFFTTHRTS